MSSDGRRSGDDVLADRLRSLSTHPAPLSGFPHLVRTAVEPGRIRFDSFRDRLEPIRSVSELEARSLVITAGEVTVALDIETREESIVVRGHLLGIALPVAVQALDRVEQELALTTTDSLGTFELVVHEPVAALAIAADRREVFVPLPADGG